MVNGNIYHFPLIIPGSRKNGRKTAHSFDLIHSVKNKERKGAGGCPGLTVNRDQELYIRMVKSVSCHPESG
jgi:hypothetical protein